MSTEPSFILSREIYLYGHVFSIVKLLELFVIGKLDSFLQGLFENISFKGSFVTVKHPLRKLNEFFCGNMEKNFH